MNLAIKQKPRYHRNGIRLKRPDAAGNARARKVGITTGLDSRAIRGELDQRFAFARAVTAYAEEYRAHVASDSVVMDDLCRSAAIHKAIKHLALARMDGQPFDNADQARAAYEALRRADADHRSILAVLGIQRREKPVPDLQDYLRQKLRRKGACNSRDVTMTRAGQPSRPGHSESARAPLHRAPGSSTHRQLVRVLRARARLNIHRQRPDHTPKRVKRAGCRNITVHPAHWKELRLVPGAALSGNLDLTISRSMYRGQCQPATEEKPSGSVRRCGMKK
jgi:hypothetical protein